MLHDLDHPLRDARVGPSRTVIMIPKRRHRGQPAARYVSIDGREMIKRIVMPAHEIAGENDEFTLPITQEELAGMIGASRERVNKAIAAFVRLGWLDQRERTYRIVDRRKLTMRSS